MDEVKGKMRGVIAYKCKLKKHFGKTLKGKPVRTITSCYYRLSFFVGADFYMLLISFKIIKYKLQA